MTAARLNILMVHNYYQQPGGEDIAFENEVGLLRSRGHSVVTYTRHNDEIGEFADIRTFVDTFWSIRSKSELESLIDDARPDLMHLHNTFPLISPSAYYAASNRDLPVIQTLHNYRLTCPAATHFRDGAPCEDCWGRVVAWPAVLHACYRSSRLHNAVVAGMLATHKLRGTYANKVNAYIVLSQFMKNKLTGVGIDPSKIHVKPNFVVDPGVGTADRDRALFVGRLSDEKGLLSLLEAWKGLSGIPLDIVGAGPLEEQLRRIMDRDRLREVRILGYQERAQVIALMKRARLLIIPSLSYEGLPTVALEAFACGTPVIASNQGALREMVEDGVQGLTFAPGDSASLLQRVQRLWERKTERQTLGRGARAAYLERYTPEANYDRLVAIYRSAMEGKADR